MLAKHELLKVPLIGWTWYFLEIVFCKRKWEEDRKTVFTGLERLKDYPECMWVSKVLPSAWDPGPGPGARNSVPAFGPLSFEAFVPGVGKRSS